MADAKATNREVSLQLAENQRQWDSRQREMSKEAAHAEALKVEKSNLAATMEKLRPQRRALEEVIAKKQALLDIVDKEKHHTSAIIEGFSNRKQKYQAAAKVHEKVRRNRDEFLRRQLAEERKAQEAEMRDAQRPMRILVSLVESLWVSLRDMLGLSSVASKEGTSAILRWDSATSD